ncbi:MAG: hypothetical protein BBJ57_07465 [Desulfobacterales bacterium PC51MH44]|nr:MAG: hypothetical protein BBJ57_07465 [Desulfobacterales bacterium PC51MH44]
MGTYENCYDIIADVRRDVNEYSEAYVQGADDTGAWSNELITQKINLSQFYLYNILFQRNPQHLYRKQVQLTAVDSVFTLPADFAKLEWFKDDQGTPVRKIPIGDLTPRGVSELMYYQQGNTLVLEKSGSTKTYTLIYRWMPRRIFAGKSFAGAATSITFAKPASKLADYYNGMIIENITKDWVDTITDYSTARVATIAETAAANDYFGLVSELPIPFHHLIAPKASMLLRASSPLAQNKVTKDEQGMFQEDLTETLLAYGGENDDQDLAEVFNDFDIGNPVLGIVV